MFVKNEKLLVAGGLWVRCEFVTSDGVVLGVVYAKAGIADILHQGRYLLVVLVDFLF